MSYESPINIIYGEINNKLENEVLTVVHNLGIDVDKEELVRALRYDREQYQKGYEDRDKEIVRCNGCKYLNTPANGVPFCKRIKKFVDANWFCGDGDMIETNQESAEDVTGLYCDDITFCWGPCYMFKCPRNKYNIRDKRVPHSFFAEGVVPDDCPKRKEKENR